MRVTIANVKGSYVSYDHTHNKLFKDRHGMQSKDLIEIVEESNEARKQ